MTIQGFITARLDEWERAARDANPGPWFYDSYARIFRPDVDDQDGFDNAGFEAGHEIDRSTVHCVPCDGPCKLWAESYRRDPLVASVPSIAGDTAIGRHMADAVHIAMHDPAVTLALVAALRAVLDEWEVLNKRRLELIENGEMQSRAWEYDGIRSEMDGIQKAILHIASAWRDHPDFDEEWLS
jgi:hypothetical protein